MSAGLRLRTALRETHPLQIVGCVNAYCAILAEKTGHKALYVSGGGVAACTHGLPDLGITNLHDVVSEVEKITRASSLPVLVDVDTGFGGAFGIARTVQDMERAGAAGFHIEDQAAEKRCGHRPNKQIVDVEEMTDRIKAAVDARKDDDFVVMARTDALANEGLDGAIERCRRYVDAGADALFPEAFTTLEQYEAVKAALPDVPVLANITEFGKTPLFTTEELGGAGVDMVLYPLSAFRAMSAAALDVYETILREGTQEPALDKMQSRMDLYDYLGYHEYEQALDRVFGGKDKK